MYVSMKPKTDTKTRPDKQPAPAPSRRRSKHFRDILARHPEMFDEMEIILKLADGQGEDGRILTADEAESRALEAIRKLGNRTMQQWAEQAQTRAVEAYKKEHPGTWLKKKAR